MDNISKLIVLVMEWWEEHQYDIQGDDGDYNVYDEPPDCVKFAISLITKERTEIENKKETK
jgi:hypothetical protein